MKLEFDVMDGIKAALIPSLILQPLVENALKFAVAGRVKGGRIRIQAQRDENKIILSVDDSGPGMEEEDYEMSLGLTFKDGVGLKNISERLEAHYGNMAGLIFKNLNLGACRRVFICLLRKAAALWGPAQPSSLLHHDITCRHS